MTIESPKERAPSIRDVARLADVSHQTVSRVLNNHQSIRDSTKDRVLAAMAQLNYRPSQVARALAAGRSRTIGVLTASNGQFGPASSLAAIENAARAAGYYVITANLNAVDPDSIADALNHLMSQSIEGLVVIAPQVRVFDVLAQMAIDIPHVSLQSTGGGGPSALAVDQIEGGRLATRHLVDLGHREILHLAGPHDWIEAEGRMRGFLDEINRADLQTHSPILGDWTADFGYFAGRELLRNRDFTAVFAANDEMAAGLLHAFRDGGVNVPADVSVVGFDDTPLAAHLWPPLTTVHENFALIGRRAVAVLLEEVRGSDDASVLLQTHPRLVVRDSTAPPPGRQAPLPKRY